MVGRLRPVLDHEQVGRVAVVDEHLQALVAGPGAGQSWDRWFLTGMIPHHQGAVEMARLVPARTQNAAVRQLAQEIIKSQSTEINQYRAWLKVVK